MEESPLFLDMPMKRTIEMNGRIYISYMNTGRELKQISVVLSASEYVHKLHLILVIKDNKGWNKERALMESPFSNKNLIHEWGTFG
jgi:hypothetical protein